MSKTLVLRTTTHIYQGGDYVLCGEPANDMLKKGDSKKIGGVKHEEFGCINCLNLLVEQWDDLNAKCGELAKYSEQDMENLLACLELMNSRQEAVVRMLLDEGRGVPSSKDVEVVPPPVKKAAAKRPARKKTAKEPPV